MATNIASYKIFGRSVEDARTRFERSIFSTPGKAMLSRKSQWARTAQQVGDAVGLITNGISPGPAPSAQARSIILPITASNWRTADV